MTNRLASETSPYLLQHAENPVDWYPWGEEAFAKARTEDKPVLVSIGYAACHWCHVMEHESFEDEAIAAIQNDLVVSIKVDREERPDVDAIYMQAVQAMHGHGGWPLNVFLMPDGRPFYGGTYFPSAPRPGMPAWTQVLQAVADAYHNRRDAVLQNADALTAGLRASAEAAAPDDPLRESVLGEAYLSLAGAFDPGHGGFGAAPKFPQSMALEFLLRFHARTGERHALHMVEHSLRRMAAGGIYDHLGGGFSRYSTDPVWLVPHFEKMLYDNALLASAYLQTYQVTGDAFYRAIARETLDYLLRDLHHPEGGFYSSQDADSEGVEGKYYVWSVDEIKSFLGDDASTFMAHYGVSERGNFEGANILRIASSEMEGDLAARERLAVQRAILMQARAQRIPPGTDDKVLTGWNALALRALAEAAFVLDDARYRDAAVQNATFLLEKLQPDGRLLRTWKDGRAHLLGYAEDHALLINGLLSLHEATYEHRWLHAAHDLTDRMLDLFWDERDDVLYDVGKDHEELVVRPRDTFDSALPSAGSAAAEALTRMAVLTGDSSYAGRAHRLLRTVAPLLSRAPQGFGNWLRVAERVFTPSTEVAMIGALQAPSMQTLLRLVRSVYAPHRTLIGLDPDERGIFPSPLLEGRGMLGTEPTAYVCHDYACELPTADPEVLARQIGA